MTPYPTHRPSSDLAAPLDALRGALVAETILVVTLREALVTQRAAIAQNSAPDVHATIADIGRLLQALADARRVRGQALHALCGDTALPLDAVEATLGFAFPSPVQEARRALRREAQAVTHEVAINHRVLRGAVEAGERFLQDLFSTLGDSTPTYTAGEGRDDPARRASVLLNKVA